VQNQSSSEIKQPPICSQKAYRAQCIKMRGKNISSQSENQLLKSLQEFRPSQAF
jgi:hypothetical protein